MYQGLFIFQLLLGFSFTLSAQFGGELYKGRLGKCYAQTLIPSKYELQEKEYPIYLGEYHDTIDFIEINEVILSPASSKWIKKITEENCTLPNPKDCFAWCLVESPKEAIELVIVKDTSQTNNYKWEKIQVRKLIEEGGYPDLREVICSDKINSEFYHKVWNIIMEKGIYTGSEKDFSESKVEELIAQYQMDNDFPIGNWNIETMDALGISIRD